MRIKIRIYNPYDLDIIALTEARHFSVANAMKQTLIYYAKGKRYLVEIPTLTEHLVNERYVKGFYVELDENDPDEALAAEFIKSIPDGLRNSFMKNIFRASFEVCPLSLYMGDGGSEYVAKMIANPRYGRHPVQREMIDHISLDDGEVGVTISDKITNVENLPHGVKASEVKKKTSQEKLRDITKSAYKNASQKEEDKKKKREDAIEKKAPEKENTVDADLDALLDSMM